MLNANRITPAALVRLSRSSESLDPGGVAQILLAQLYAAPRVQNEHLRMTCTLVHACALASCAHVLCWVGPAAYARLVVELRGRVVVGLGGSGGDRALCLSGLWCTLWVVYALAHTVLGPPSPLSFPLLGAMAANVFPG